MCVGLDIYLKAKETLIHTYSNLCTGANFLILFAFYDVVRVTDT